MIIIEGWVRLAPGELEKFLPVALKMVAETRKEAGCLDYAFARDIGEPDLIRLIERWKDEAAVTAHFATPHMAAFNAALTTAKITGADVTAWSANLVRTVLKV
jgi:quinol monooxygenase YgiN